MNCFSRGREVRRRCKSVPRSSVTVISSKCARLRGKRIQHTDIHVLERGNEDIAETDDLLYVQRDFPRRTGDGVESYVFMAQVLEQLQLTVCALGQDRRAEWLHNLLDRDRRGSELILGRAVPVVSARPVIFFSWIRLTIQARRRPCPQAADPSTWFVAVSPCCPRCFFRLCRLRRPRRHARNACFVRTCS